MQFYDMTWCVAPLAFLRIDVHVILCRLEPKVFGLSLSLLGQVSHLARCPFGVSVVALRLGACCAVARGQIFLISRSLHFPPFVLALWRCLVPL